MMKPESQTSLTLGEGSAQKHVVIPVIFLHTNNETPKHLVADMCVGIKIGSIAKTKHYKTTRIGPKKEHAAGTSIAEHEQEARNFDTHPFDGKSAATVTLSH